MSEGKGKIYYGMHFYSGLAEYQEDGQDPYRVYLNEDTIRSMDPSFAGCPVFVLHVDEVEPNLDKLREESDGWVVESFYNKADGKHWVKFVVVSKEAEAAIAKGMRLSNCYTCSSFGPGGVWNGIDYQKQVESAQYEHLAIVPNPRYEESIILTPEQFKKYNEDKDIELKKLSNNKHAGDGKMRLSFFKRAKVENSADIENMSVELPKSKTEVSLSKLINEADEKEMKKGEPEMAHPDHHVDLDGEKVKVKDLVNRYKDACSSLHMMKDSMKDSAIEKEGGDDEDVEKKEEKEDREPKEANDEDDQDLREAKKAVPKSDDDKAGERESLKLEREEEREVKDARKRNALEKAQAARTANNGKYMSSFDREPTVKFSFIGDEIAKGKKHFGS